jgi:hypothetical protein
MTDAEKLTILKSMLDSGDTTSDETATAYLLAAEKAVINIAFPFGNGTEIMPSKYDYEQIEIALYMLNKRGSEGEVLHIEAGTHRSFEVADIPISLRARITPFAGGF